MHEDMKAREWIAVGRAREETKALKMWAGFERKAPLWVRSAQASHAVKCGMEILLSNDELAVMVTTEGGDRHMIVRDGVGGYKRGHKRKDEASQPITKWYNIKAEWIRASDVYGGLKLGRWDTTPVETVNLVDRYGDVVHNLFRDNPKKEMA